MHQERGANEEPYCSCWEEISSVWSITGFVLPEGYGWLRLHWATWRGYASCNTGSNECLLLHCDTHVFGIFVAVVESHYSAIISKMISLIYKTLHSDAQLRTYTQRKNIFYLAVMHTLRSNLFSINHNDVNTKQNMGWTCSRRISVECWT